MELQFLGAATTVTGSQFLLVTGRARILVDCGMFQGNPHDVLRNRVPFAYDPRSIDAVLLTHAHLDHCGLLPHLVAGGYRGPIYATRGTAELAGLVMLDSAKLQEEFASRESRFAKKHPDRAAHKAKDEAAAFAAVLVTADTADPEESVRGQPPSAATDLDAPLYRTSDAQQAIAQLKGVAYDTETDVATGVRATFLDAGHILGSAIIRVVADDRTIVFSGDLGRPGTPIIRDPEIPGGADYLLVETTYGGREHEPEAEATRLLAEAVRLVGESRGVLLVPSFAIGRTQEVVYALDRLLERGTIPHLPLYLDSPMASKATDIYRRHAEYFDDETKALLATGIEPLDYPGATVTNNAASSRAIADAPRPYMIVASNGMLTGGRVVEHLSRLIDDPVATILFVGYQGEGTLGAHLQQGATTVNIDGRPRDVRCRVRSISGFSAHADESELLDWIGTLARATPKPKRVFLVHGDPAAQAAIEPKIRAFGVETHIPTWRETVTLD